MKALCLVALLVAAAPVAAQPLPQSTKPLLLGKWFNPGCRNYPASITIQAANESIAVILHADGRPWTARQSGVNSQNLLNSPTGMVMADGANVFFLRGERLEYIQVGPHGPDQCFFVRNESKP